MSDFPWVDPGDTGYEIERFDPAVDSAPSGEGDDCTGEEDPDGAG